MQIKNQTNISFHSHHCCRIQRSSHGEKRKRKKKLHKFIPRYRLKISEQTIVEWNGICTNKHASKQTNCYRSIILVNIEPIFFFLLCILLHICKSVSVSFGCADCRLSCKMVNVCTSGVINC